VGFPELLVFVEDAVEELVVGRVAEECVLQEGKCGAVGPGEVFAHKVISTGEHRFEAVLRCRHLPREHSDPLMVWVRLAQLRRDLVGRPLPDLVNQSMKMSISARASSAG